METLSRAGRCFGSTLALCVALGCWNSESSASRVEAVTPAIQVAADPVTAVPGAGEQVYMVLELAAARLSLVMACTTLRSFEVEAVEVGRRRFGDRGPALGPVVWANAHLEPAREMRRDPVLVHDGSGAPPVEIPPSPEEFYPAPPRWRLVFDGGGALEVVSGEGGVATAGAFSALRRWLGRVTRPDEEENLRLRVTLAADQAAELYRAIPDGTTLVVGAML